MEACLSETLGQSLRPYVFMGSMGVVPLELTSAVQIPPHGRWRHLDAGRPRVEPLIAKWKASSSPPDSKEICRRLIDLFLVSVLLDAGAGNTWRYAESESGQSFSRSEGLGVASINMFEEGFFSGDTRNPYQVDGSPRHRFSRRTAWIRTQPSYSCRSCSHHPRTNLCRDASQLE